MTQLLIDGISTLSIHNGMLRIECVAVGPDTKPHPSGTLLIPAPAAAGVLQALTTGMQELDKKIREQVPTAGNA
jgi:hypothetical protein